MHLDTFYARTPEGIAAYDFQQTNDKHYVTPTYGPPAPWPAHMPSAVRPTPYYGFGPAEKTPLRGATVLIRPRGQETPVRTNVSLMGLGAGEGGSKSADKGPWKDRHPLQYSFAQDMVQLSKEQPWFMGLVVVLGGALAMKALGVFGSLGR